MSLVEVSPLSPGGTRPLFGIGKAKVVCSRDHYRPEAQEYMSRLEVGIDRRLSDELRAGDLVCLGPDGSGSVRLTERLGTWDESPDHPLMRWSGQWATDLSSQAYG